MRRLEPTLRTRGPLLPIAVCALACLLAGCASDRTGALPVPIPPAAPRAGLARAADPDHAALVRALGGEARAPGARAYLSEVVSRLVARTESPGETYEVTILDSPSVNAFALPSGRLYVTRGLLALANDTSEIAAVMAHEIAHVTRRHASLRGEMEARATLVSRVVSDVLNDPAGSAQMRDRSRATIAGFSRDQEYEADAIGIATVAAAGYDPSGSVRTLASLGRYAGFGAPAADRRGGPDLFSTHPDTPARIARAREAARRLDAAGGRTERAAYLAAIDGIAFGDNPSDGIVRGRRFLHPRFGVAFDAPDGVRMENTPSAVLGSSPDGERRLLFDAVEAGDGAGLDELLRTSWSDALTPDSLAMREVNGRPVAVAASRGAEWSFRLAAIRMGATAFRLILASRAGGPALDAEFDRVLASIRPLGPEDSGLLRPQRIAVVRAEPGDTPATMAARMASDRPLDRFLVLNGLEPGAALKTGERYKVVVD